MSVPYKEIKKILKKSKVSVPSLERNDFVVKDSTVFKGLPVSEIQEITDMVDKGLKDDALKRYKSLDSIDAIRKRSERSAAEGVLNYVRTKNPNSIYSSLRNPKNIKEVCQGEFSTHDSVLLNNNVYNDRLNINNNADIMNETNITPNLWVSPWEASALYSHKGLIETVINKKSKSIQLNGVKIQNTKLSAKQLDKVAERMFSIGAAHILSNAVRDGLVFGGSLMFPMFKKDTPLTMGMSIGNLLKYGIAGKDCIERFVTLDRWNTMILPATNPTQKDFITPDKYFIPFLGAWVSGSRCSRIVPSQQAGWFGYMFTQGWGVSDIVGYYKEYCDYMVTIRQVPLMIKQMSILVRTINPDGILATEGSNALDQLLESETIRMREVSANNPISMDVMGNLTSVDRDFSDLGSLIRLLQSDFGAKSNVPAPLIWSSEKGNFSSGDDTEGDMSKQWESVKFIHKDSEYQSKNFAMLMILDTLGATAEVLEALPYTQIKFDTPVIASAVERAKIGNDLSETYFNLVGGQMPMDKALQITSGFAGDDMSINSDIIESLQQKQAELDNLSKQRAENEIALQEAQIEQIETNCENAEAGVSSTGIKSTGSGEEKKYSRIEQKQHEKVRADYSRRSEKLAKNRSRYEKKKIKVTKEE